ncbi:MAG: hypothetical protein R3Y57_07635 [Erysipelotrichaceae bacterium]
MKYNQHKSSLGLDANIVSALIYVLPILIIWFLTDYAFIGWLVIGVVIFMEKQSTLVRFHAYQELFLLIANTIFNFIAVIITITLGMFGMSSGSVGFLAVIIGIVSIIVLVVSVTITVLSLFSAFNAYNWKTYQLPLIGKWAKKASKE